MSLVAHLLELRRRIVITALAIALGAVAGWLISGTVLDALRAPIAAMAAEQHRVAELNYDGITAAFDLRFHIAIAGGIVLASPVWLYQVWAFLVPALTRKERRYVVGFVGSAVVMFLAGCVMGWLLVPHMVALLAGFAPGGDTTFLRANTYFDFVVKLVVAVGIAFVLPVFVVLLNIVGVLKAAAIWRSWRIAVIGILLFTALVTPSADVVSMFLLALPMVALYVAAGGIATVHDRRALRRARALELELELATTGKAVR
jgi:sec-independent protein translocase protein TatC